MLTTPNVSKVFVTSILIAGVSYLIYTSSTPGLFDLEDDKKKRLANELKRGTVVSLASSLIMNIVGYFMLKAGVDENHFVVNYGYLLGPVIGYFLDITFASEDGVRRMGTYEGLKYSFASLLSPKFYRYIITVFLDLFISNPMQDSLKLMGETFRNKLVDNSFKDVYGQFIKTNFPSILQSLVGIITFHAYTNETRFKWAYTDSESNEKLPNIIMLVATAIGASLFSTYNIKGADSLERRVFIAVTSILVLSLGSMMKFKRDEEDITMYDADDDDIRKNYGISSDVQAGGGVVVFLLFLYIGVVYPIQQIKYKRA